MKNTLLLVSSLICARLRALLWSTREMNPVRLQRGTSRERRGGITAAAKLFAGVAGIGQGSGAGYDVAKGGSPCASSALERVLQSFFSEPW
jgi:hypothetical protein